MVFPKIPNSNVIRSKRPLSPAPRSPTTISGVNRYQMVSPVPPSKETKPKKQKNDVGMAKESQKQSEPAFVMSAVSSGNSLPLAPQGTTFPLPTFLPAADMSASSSNEDLQLILSKIQTNISDFPCSKNTLSSSFTSPTGSTSTLLSPNVLSPTGSGFLFPSPGNSGLFPAGSMPTVRELKAGQRSLRKQVKVLDLAMEEDICLLIGYFKKKIDILEDPKKIDIRDDPPPSTHKVAALMGSKLTAVLKTKSVASRTPASAAAAPGVTADQIPETMDEPGPQNAHVLPFKKRVYKSVPSPNDSTKNAGKDSK